MSVEIKPAGGPAIFVRLAMEYYEQSLQINQPTVIQWVIKRVLGRPELKFSAEACVLAKARAFRFLRKPRKPQTTRYQLHKLRKKTSS
jgi:hypothetical protein